jgi:dihydroorotase
MYDLLIRNGTLIDPSQSIEGPRDVAVADGRVAAVDDRLEASSATTVLDAAGKLVTPGLIDLHVHAYWGGTPSSVDPDATCLAKGVTTVLDAGSAGCRNFLGFRHVIDRARTRVLALLHIASTGLISKDLTDISVIDYDGAVATALAYREVVRGFKMYFAVPPQNFVGRNGPVAMRLTREAADDIDGQIMVHPKSMDRRYRLVEILKLMRAGDIVTHCFSPTYPLYFPHAEILDAAGHVLPEVTAAAARGVVFDVGHGSGSLSFDTAQKALADGFLPTTISTDLHRNSLQTAVDFPTTLSKFLALGLPLSKVVELSTVAPAALLGFEGQLGTIAPGAVADIAVFDYLDGQFTFHDVRGNPLVGAKLLKPRGVVKDGELVTWYASAEG